MLEPCLRSVFQGLELRDITFEKSEGIHATVKAPETHLGLVNPWKSPP